MDLKVFGSEKEGSPAALSVTHIAEDVFVESTAAVEGARPSDETAPPPAAAAKRSNCDRLVAMGIGEGEAVPLRLLSLSTAL